MNAASILAPLLALVLAAGPALAAPLTLVCKVQSSNSGYQRRGLRRLEIDLAAKTVRVSDNTGKGFQVRGVRPLVGAEAGRYVLEAGGGKESYVDRKSGRYYFRNEAEKLVIQGRCEKSAG